MAHNSYFKTRKAEAAIPAYSIVKRGSADGTIVLAAAATDKLIGVTDNIASVIGDNDVDVNVSGQHFVKLGGTVAEWDPLTSDANGNAIVSAPGSGVNNRIIGFAMQAGVAGDVINYLGEPSYHRG